ncbi:hypothetical protein [Nostoc sp. CHAB 5715]|uniref:hypothetical protein n=1 Tax=Nostoc sp. CHAB 5715 TaxID=2780400 RepID=UPI001E43DE7D|nr:hypothetical protein [Nostoc sp. CHAB 5715]MCC5623107.1 hypothetical protein [Nostoc sp. CHAB 5715]
MVPKKAVVTVSSQSHPRDGESGVIEADAPNNYQQIVTFSDGERLLVNNADLADAIVSESNERTYPKEYAEAIAQISSAAPVAVNEFSSSSAIAYKTDISENYQSFAVASL